MNSKNKFLYIIFLIYIISAFYVIFFPIHIYAISNFKLSESINLIPGMVLYDDYLLIERGIWFQAFKQTFGNFVLLAPAGFLIPLIWENKINNYKNAFKFGFLISLSIETLQLFITFILQSHYKVFDVDDLILNTSGFVLGYYIYKKFFKK